MVVLALEIAEAVVHGTVPADSHEYSDLVVPMSLDIDLVPVVADP